MKVLVTGATGFLGSWLVKYLVREGLEVSILRREKSDLRLLQNLSVEHCFGDVTDMESLNKAMSGVDSVFHLAGIIAYQKSQRKAMESVNVGGTQNVIEAIRRQGVRRLVHVSSVVAVGASFDGSLLNENSEYNVSHLKLGYFETKHQGELIVKKAIEDHQIDAVIVNPSTVYGPGDTLKGSRKLQLKVAQGRMPFYTKGGVSIAYIDDVIGAIFQAWQKGVKGQRYILSGENITVQKMFELIAKKAGVQPPRWCLPTSLVRVIGGMADLLEDRGVQLSVNRESGWMGTLYHWFDSSKAQRELGLRVTSADVSIAKSLEWAKKEGYL